jgi:hypothetical protein
MKMTGMMTRALEAIAHCREAAARAEEVSDGRRKAAVRCRAATDRRVAISAELMCRSAARMGKPAVQSDDPESPHTLA